MLSLCFGLSLFAGRVSGQLRVDPLETEAPPGASIICADTAVCLGDSVRAYISFTGDGPWDAVVNDDDGEYAVLENVTSPYTIYLKPETDNTYYVASVIDIGGNPGSTTGEVPLSVYESTPVTIKLDQTAYRYTDPGVALLSDPAGGVFKGEGISSNYFYPGIATPVNSPYTITCIYTNQFECKSSDETEIHVLYADPKVYLTLGDDTINALCDETETYVIRGSNNDNIPGKFELVVAGSNEPIPGHITDNDTLDDLATLNITGLKGAYDIIYTYQFQKLVADASRRFVINDLGEIGIVDLPAAVCKNDDPYLLVPELSLNDPGAIYFFSGQGVTGNQEDGFYYNPAADDAPLGKNEINLSYTSSNGCSSSSVRIITNNFVPDVKFSLSPICIPAGGGDVAFRNLSSGKYSVDNWVWDFGDPGSGSGNTSNEEHSEHYYSEGGEYEIKLTANTTEGCVVSYVVDTVLSDEPVADFTWLSDCFAKGRPISFIDRSTSANGAIDIFLWTFKTLNGGVLGWEGTGSPTDTVEFQFPSQNNYFVELEIENEAGCSGSVTREIELKPTISIPDSGYEIDFNDVTSDWQIVSPDENKSWKLGEPDFSGFEPIPGNKAWYTDLPVHYEGYQEMSWVQSPCFDLRELDKPLIQMDLMKSFEPGVDGAVLQYQDVFSEGWKTLGNLDDGMNWYNTSGILNKPGGSSFGWGLNLFDPDSNWQKASHDLNAVAQHPAVKFRVIIGTGGEKAIGNQGFAFDNIFLGERGKLSLLEYFTNSSSSECRITDHLIDNFVRDHSFSVIDLQYHMDFPGTDPMNENNTLTPFTRFFNMSVPGVPYALLNGGLRSEYRYDFSDLFNQPGEKELEQASLMLPLFKIDLSTEWLENKFDATVQITCTTDIFSSSLLLYLAVIETSVTAYTGINQDTVFRNVVLDMLPLPTGEWIGNDWYNGKIESRSYSWDYAEYTEDIEDLAVVAFVEDSESGEVLQVASEYLTPQVGMVFKKPLSGIMAVYPNPADDYLFINLGNSDIENGLISLIDISGKVRLSQEFEPGFNLYRMDVSQLSEGLYMIYLTESGLIKGRSRIIVAR